MGGSENLPLIMIGKSTNQGASNQRKVCFFITKLTKIMDEKILEKWDAGLEKNVSCKQEDLLHL